VADHPETTAPALTMLPPWSWAIVHAGKRLENRDWKRGCSYRGPVWLHTSNAPSGDPEKVLRSASKTADEYADGVSAMLSAIRRTGVDTGPVTHGALLATRGMILGRARVVSAIRPGSRGYSVEEEHIVAGMSRRMDRAITDAEAAWWTGGFALVLDDVIALPEPVPCKGALGFWTVPDDVEAKCLAQIVRTS
jgi:hypothetical protein